MSTETPHTVIRKNDPESNSSRQLSSDAAMSNLLKQEAKRSVSPSLIEYLIRIGDLLAIIICGILSIVYFSDRIATEIMPQYTNIVIVGSILANLSIFISGGYDTSNYFNLWRSLKCVISGWILACILILLVGFTFKITGSFSRIWAGSWFIVTCISLILSRTIICMVALSMRQKGRFDSRAIILGAGDQGQRLHKFLTQNKSITLKILAFFDDREDRIPDEIKGVPVIIGTNRLIELIRSEKVDQIIVALPWQANHRLRYIVELIAETPIKIRLAPDLAMYDFLNRDFTSLGGLPVLDIFDRPLSGWNFFIKRLEDLILGSIFLILISPILLMTAIAIKLDSKGPIFFRQLREGYNNKTFHVWKFRSMRADLCEESSISQVKKNDVRVTRIGSFLRKTSIDELPQLLNVIAGDMSIVGPRPHSPSTKAAGVPFEVAVKRYAARHKVKPGITGWAQINGWRGETDTLEKLEQRLQHDLYYIDHWSWVFDISIIIRTVLIVLRQKEAY